MGRTTKKCRLAIPAMALPILAALAAGMASMPGYGQGASERLATDVANDLANRRPAEGVGRFTADMAKGLPLAALEKVWEGVLQQRGAVREIAPARVERIVGTGVTVVIVPVWFERAMLDLRISLSNDKVAGFYTTEVWSN